MARKDSGRCAITRELLVWNCWPCKTNTALAEEQQKLWGSFCIWMLVEHGFLCQSWAESRTELREVLSSIWGAGALEDGSSLRSLQSFCLQQRKASHSCQENFPGWVWFFRKQICFICMWRIMTRAPNVNTMITGMVFAIPNCSEQLLGNQTETRSCDYCYYCKTG